MSEKNPAVSFVHVTAFSAHITQRDVTGGNHRVLYTLQTTLTEDLNKNCCVQVLLVTPETYLKKKKYINWDVVSWSLSLQADASL